MYFANGFICERLLCSPFRFKMKARVSFMWKTHFEYFYYDCQWNGIRLHSFIGIDRFLAMNQTKLIFHVDGNACWATQSAQFSIVAWHQCSCNAMRVADLWLQSQENQSMCFFCWCGCCLDSLKVMQFNFGVVQLPYWIYLCFEIQYANWTW